MTPLLSKSKQFKNDLMDKVDKMVTARLSKADAEHAGKFVKQFYEKVSARDLIGVTEDAVFGSAMSFWRFAAHRKEGQDLIRVYNPNLEENGWQSDHSVVEICTKDRPFLVDSMAAALNELEISIYQTIHPVIAVCRDEKGKLVATLQDKEKPKKSWGEVVQADESFMMFYINRQSGEDHLSAIAEHLQKCLTQGGAAVKDWQAMVTACQQSVDELRKNQAKSKSDLAVESGDFLQWIHDNHFTFLGVCDFDIKGDKIVPVKESALGILSTPGTRIVDEMCSLATSKQLNGAKFTENDDPLMVAKSNIKSLVHRPVYMDVICVKRYAEKGKVTGQRVFVGLFTSAAYSRAPRDIPLIRHKAQKLMDQAGFPGGSHNNKALAHIVDTFPRDELFQMNDEELFDTCMGILHLQERQRVALFVRRDSFDRFVSCMIFAPRDNFSTELRHEMQDILANAYQGEVMGYYTQIGDMPLARLHVLVSTEKGNIEQVDLSEIEMLLTEAARSWADQLCDALVAAHGEEKGLEQFRRYRKAFPSGYGENHNAATAVSDITKMEEVIATDELQLSLYRPIEADETFVRFKLYHPHKAVPLSHVLPMLENMGLQVLDEQPHAVKVDTPNCKLIMIHDFGLVSATGKPVNLSAIRTNFQDTFRQVWKGDVENDGFNRLVIQAGVKPWAVMLLRALCKYLRQAKIPFSQTYMQRALAHNPDVTKRLVDLFYLKFDPKVERDEARVAEIRTEILEILDGVANADEDRILRRFLNLIDCTLRTNYFQTDDQGGDKPYVSFKFNSTEIEDLPLPRPWREIFVYSPRVEGVHLRGGPVARGGLRWSDRREDFRTEILGLVKAQQVKNAVIVPVGSKGGFVVKQPPVEGGRDAFMAEGIECYKTFIRGLLDLTDNYVDGKVIAPKEVVRHDDDDPYLVVAADKGTATFSDIANGVSEEYGHWLGDAFASGGSAGYDHKKMGITAKGAWESVKRHFRELDKDIQTEEFTVAGVGDMGGDVFGNGMLLSEKIRLVAAFNHLHIFVDPNPDAASSFKERKRLFDEVKGWDHYDTSLISKGGGVFLRSAKKIDVTPEMAKALKLDSKTQSLTPNELIRAILRSHVELLWFGGIGTYIKSSHESHADTGDRSNDNVRVNALDLNCQVVGEGANLGVTQSGRIEYALVKKGKINTDAIDNSAGVDCSDHEVNIKILLNSVVANGDMTMKQRNQLLEKMTDEVSSLVLRDNYLQSQAISMISSQASEILDQQTRLMKFLERQGRLDRDVENLPNDEELAERAAKKGGLSRPEISVLMPHAKIWLYDQLLASDLPDEPCLEEDLIRYFPSDLQTKFEKEISNHMLRREIIATHITNSLINRVGGIFVTQMMENTNATPQDVARAYLITRDSFNLRQTWADIEALDNKAPASEQIRMIQHVNRLIDRGTKWFLRNGGQPLEIGKSIDDFAGGIARLADNLEEVLPKGTLKTHLAKAQSFIDNDVPEDLAKRVAGKIVLVSGCDIVCIAQARDLDVVDVAKVYFEVGNRFDLGWMRATGETLGLKNHWQKLAVGALMEDLYTYQSTLTHLALDARNGAEDARAGIDNWIEQNQVRVDQTKAMISEMKTTAGIDFAMLTVAGKQFRDLVG